MVKICNFICKLLTFLSPCVFLTSLLLMFTLILFYLRKKNIICNSYLFFISFKVILLLQYIKLNSWFVKEIGSSYTRCNSKRVIHFLSHWFSNDQMVENKPIIYYPQCQLTKFIAFFFLSLSFISLFLLISSKFTPLPLGKL